MLRDLLTPASFLDSSPGGLARLLALPVICLLLVMSAHVSQAVTINVTNDCELDAAIKAANNDSNSHDTDCTAGSGADTIDLTNMSDPTNLGAALTNITSDITISGAAKTLGGSNSYRLFYVASGGKLTLNNIYLTEGSATGNGGAIYVANGGSLSLNKAFIHNNSSSAFGGGIYSDGSVTMTGSAIYSNTSSSSAGGIMADGGTLRISRSAIRNNDSTLGGGGGIFSEATLTIENSTISGNTANGNIGGGGIYINLGTATITHTTIHDNTAGVSGTGTGLRVESTAGAVSLRNSIVSNSDAELDCKLATGASLAQNIGNVIQNGEGNCTAPDTRNDPGLDALTSTDPAFHPLQSASEAIGAGAPGICRAYAQDQNRIYRPATGCDAGAAERDGYNYIDVSSTCSLSDAFTSANTNVASGGCLSGLGDDIAIDFIRLKSDVELSASLGNVDSTIILDGGGRTVSKLSTAGDFRPFDVFSGGDLTLRNITVWGFSQTSGGAVFNRDTLRLEDCLFVGNKDVSGAGGGGALHLGSGQTSTTINRCAFKDNDSVNDAGGAIRTGGGNLIVSNSTFIGNTCATDGCAIQIDGGTVELSHNTFWNNASDGTGNISGVNGGGGTVDILNSIIGRDTTIGGRLCGGSFNNYSAERGIIMWNGPTQNDPCGKVTFANPNLGAETGSVPYLPLRAGSPAIGAGIGPLASTCARYPTDQRGASRPASGCDLGAVQFIEGEPPKQSSGPYVRPTPIACTGDWLNDNTGIRISASYDICDGAQFQLRDISAIGIQWIVDAGPLDVLDAWGWIRPTAEICFPQAGSMLFISTSNGARSVTPLDSFRDGDLTCARIKVAGTIVLLPADSPHSTPPADIPPGPLVAPVPEQVSAPMQATAVPTAIASTPLSNCMVRTKAILNMRASPSGRIVGLVPWEAWLTALEYAPGWYKIDFHGDRGWISADYVEPRGSCA